MELSRDFREFFVLLARHEVRYLVIGGYAMAAHGHPRFTKDLDIWVWIDRSNSRAVLAALVDFGFDGLGLSQDDFLAENMVIQLGYPPQRIDLLTSPSGVDFDACWEDRLTLTIDDIEVAVIGLRGLIQNKIAAGRDQDVVDANALQRLLPREDRQGESSAPT